MLVNATGGTGTLQYQLNSQPFQSSTNVYEALTAGVYTVNVKDSKGCTAQASAEVKQPPALSVSVTAIAPKCAGVADGALYALASGGAGDYRYLINSGAPQVSGTFVNLKANTTYALTISDRNNCVFFRDVSIGPPTTFDIKLTAKAARCAGSADGSIMVAATGGTGTYQYQIGARSFQTGNQFTGLTANSYEITVQDGTSCQGKQTVAVGEPAALKLTAVSRPVNCFGPNSGTITVTSTGGTGAVQYQLTTGKIPQSNPAFTGLAVGDYTVVGTDANGCTNLVSVMVNKADALKVQAISTAATCCVCPTGTVKLVSLGGTGSVRNYQINGQSYQSNSQFNGLRPDTYRLRVVDEVGCADSAVAVITDGNALTLTISTSKDVTCVGGQDGAATVQVAGGKKPFVFYWSTERRDTLKTFGSTQAGLPEGSYTVSVIDSNRCSTATLFVPIKTKYPIPPKPTITQIGGSTLVADQSVGIQWYVRTGVEPGKPVPNATNSSLMPFQSGLFYVTSTVNGCVSPVSNAISFVLTALAEPLSSLAVRVVPNPVIDRLRLEIEQAERSAVLVQLLDASGRAVMEQLVPAFTGRKQAEWLLPGMAAGTYLLKISADNRQSVLRVAVE